MKELTHLKEAIEKHQKEHPKQFNSFRDNQLIEAAQSLVEALEGGDLGVVEWNRGYLETKRYYLETKRYYIDSIYIGFPRVEGLNACEGQRGHLFFLPAKSEGDSK